MEISAFEIVPTADGTLTVKNQSHGQLYHSHAGARFEADELFIKGSGFSAALHHLPEVAVLDVGLGLGYNAVHTIESWRESASSAHLTLVSLEADEELFRTLISGQAPWQENWNPCWRRVAELPQVSQQPHSGIFHVTWQPDPGAPRTLKWYIYIGDALDFDFTSWQGRFHYIWHDPFSPAVAPSLWSENFFSSLRVTASRGCCLMTYSAAGVTKRSLKAAGWYPQVIPTPGPKRHWLKAVLP